MTQAEKLILVGICGTVVGLCAGIAVHDWSMSAHAGEKERCLDEPDRKAMMIRLPGESHATESCAHIMRYGDPRWIPEFQHPLGPPKNLAK